MPRDNPASPLVSDYRIVVNGAPLPVEVQTHLVSIVVDDDISLPGMFTLELVGSIDQTRNVAWIDDDKLFAVGLVVEVKLGYMNDLETLIVGEITGLEPEFAIDRLPSLTVRGYDRRHRLHRGRKTRTFVRQTDSNIVSQIASEAGLSAKCTDSQVRHEYVVQAHQTDMEFLQERARLIQYELKVDDRTLIFRPVSNADSEVATLTMEDDLLEFYPRLSSVVQVSEVTVHGWDPKEKKGIVGRARKGDEVSTMGGQKSGAALVASAFGAADGGLSRHPVMTQAEADQIAKARFNDKVLALIMGEGVCLGRTDIRPGTVIKLNGLGKRFSGNYYVTAAVHRYSAGRGYTTHFSVRRNAA